MGLRQETELDLRAELARLERRMVALREILGESEENQPREPNRLEVAAEIAPGNKGITRNGLRQWIRETVAEKPGLKSSEIARRIEAGGFKSDATTPLAIRVNNEVRRMSSDGGSLRKRGGKYYLALDKEHGPKVPQP